MSLLVNQLGEALAAMKARAERAEAQVQAVRVVLADYVPFPDSLTADILRAMDEAEARDE